MGLCVENEEHFQDYGSFWSLRTPSLRHTARIEHLLTALHAWHGLHVLPPVAHLRGENLRKKTNSVTKGLDWTHEGYLVLVPCPAWRPPSSQTWGWPSGPWSLCVWSPGGLSSSHLQTLSPSSGPASWTFLRDPAPSASAHGSKIGKTGRRVKPGCWRREVQLSLRVHLHHCCVFSLWTRSRTSPRLPRRSSSEAACTDSEEKVGNFMSTHVL